MAIGSMLLQRFYLQDRTTAILSSAPGHLSFVLSLGAGTGGNLASIGIVQSIRLLCLTLLVPVIVSFEGFHLPVVGNPTPAAMDLLAVAVLFAICAICGLVGHWFRLPAGILIGSMLASTLGHLTGFFEGVTPQWLALPAYVVMGTLIGTRFSGISIPALAMNASAGLATTAVAVLVSVAAASAAAPITGMPLASVMVAFAPGGVETMSAMALLVGADPAYVAAHHVLRLFMLTALIPLFLRGSTLRR
jgi:membrane AbrB-like protein